VVICASCDLEIPDEHIICLRCDPPGIAGSQGVGGVSHRELARTVRRLKGLVMLSVLFGIFVAPFAFIIASKTLRQHRQAADPDPATGRQLLLMKRLSLLLLIAWIIVLVLRFVVMRELFMER
jgi:hypothetical protein